MSYVIETGIPIPQQKRTVWRGRPRSELSTTMVSMDVGQSFLVDSMEDLSRVKGLSATLKPLRFTQRKSREGWRIWRVE